MTNGEHPLLGREPADTSARRRLQPSGHWDWHISTPFSQGWRVGNLLFSGGQLSADADGNVLGPGDIEAQTRNVYENLTRVLHEGGATWNDVVKLNTFYVFDGDEAEAQTYWETMSRVRFDYIPDPGPAATAIRVAGLMYPGFLIEADVIAVIS